MKKTNSLPPPRAYSDRIFWGWLIAIMLVAAGLRLYDLGGPSFWFDEVLTVSLSSAPLGEIAANVRNAEQTPPLFHYVMHGWMGLFGLSEFAVRLPAALCGIASVWMTYKLGRHLMGRWEGLICALLMAISPFQVIYSQEARVYSALMLTALLSTYMFVKVLREGGLRNEMHYVLATGLMYWVHLHSVFVVAAQQICWIYLHVARERPADVRRISPARWIYLTGAALALFIPWMPTVWYWIHGVSQAFWIGAMSPWLLPQSYAMYAGSAVMLIALLGLGSLGLMKMPRWQGVLLVGLLLIPVIVPYGISLLTRPLFIPRYAIASAIGLYLLAARGVIALPRPAWRIASVAALAGLSAYGMIGVRERLAPKPDVRGATRYVIGSSHPGDVLALNAGNANLTLRHYTRDEDLRPFHQAWEAGEIPPASIVPADKQMWILSLRGADWRYPQEQRDHAPRQGWKLAETKSFNGALVERFTH
jgi:mannosyltransferase